jgi:probable addiction module antidote protein
MAETFSRYDAADYLKTPEDIAEYLNVSAEDGDPSVMAAALGAVARAQNMSQLAREVGMTREGLYKALSSGGNPGFGTVTKVAHALGFDVTFQPHTDQARTSLHLRRRPVWTEKRGDTLRTLMRKQRPAPRSPASSAR